MGNKVSRKSSYNLREMEELSQFISTINMLDGFFMDTTLSISSKCLVIINNLINEENANDTRLMSGLSIQRDDLISSEIEKLKFHCGLIRHLAVVNSSIDRAEELVELHNVSRLTSLTLDHVSIRLVQHLKQHRQTLMKLCVYHSISNLESLINLCGGDHSFSDKWINLLHLDIRYNHLRHIDDSVSLLVNLTVLDISRNDIDDLSFIQKIPSLICLNASFNNIRSIPVVSKHHLRVLILGYNYMDGLEGIKELDNLTTLNVAFNMIATNDYLQQLRDMDTITDLILNGNPLFYCHNYRLTVLNVVSPRVSMKFALDGVILTKRENMYLRKRAVIEIAPALAPLSSGALFRSVPVIMDQRSYNTQPPPHLTHSLTADSQQSYARRHLHCPTIANPGDSPVHHNETEDVLPLLNEFTRHRERRIESLSISDGTLVQTVNSEVFRPRIESLISYEDTNINQNPYYVGDKCSKYFLVSVDHVWKSFFNVSIQIIEHKLMIVDEADVIVDNADLWTLIATSQDSLHKEKDDPGTLLKMVFFVRSSGESGSCLVLCTRTVEFVTDTEFQIFSEQLNLYLRGFSVVYSDWSLLPLTGITISCKKCFSKYTITQCDKTSRHRCDVCTSTEFLLSNIVPKAAVLSSTPIKEHSSVAQSSPGLLTPVLRKASQHKSSTSNLVIRNFGSMESLAKRGEDKESLNSEDTSYYTAINDSTIEQSLKDKWSSQGAVSEQCLDSSIDSRTPRCYKGVDDYDDDNDMLTILDKPLDPSFLNLEMSLTSISKDHLESDRRPKLKLDRPIDASMLSLGKEIVPHQVPKVYTPRDEVLAQLNVPWVVHEPSCDVNIYQHNYSKMDDRVKLHFLTKVMEDKEDLLAVFKVYVAYRSTAVTLGSLLLFSDQRVMVFNLVDKISANMEECIKLAYEFKLKSLQQLEYCLNHQWLELSFKNKSILTLFVGDGDTVKGIGACLKDAASNCAVDLSVISSEDIAQLRSPSLFASLISDMYDGVSMTSLSKGQSFLIRASSMFPVVEKSSLEYAPKFLIIEPEHIFFCTLSYSAKVYHVQYDLARTVLLQSIKNSISLDSNDKCAIRLIAFERGINLSIDIAFMSPHSRSRAVLCIETMVQDLFRVDVILKVEPLVAVDQ